MLIIFTLIKKCSESINPMSIWLYNFNFKVANIRLYITSKRNCTYRIKYNLVQCFSTTEYINCYEKEEYPKLNTKTRP